MGSPLGEVDKLLDLRATQLRNGDLDAGRHMDAEALANLFRYAAKIAPAAWHAPGSPLADLVNAIRSVAVTVTVPDYELTVGGRSERWQVGYEPWRAGYRPARTVYRQIGDQDDGELIGVMDTADLAQRVVDAVNAQNEGEGDDE